MTHLLRVASCAALLAPALASQTVREPVRLDPGSTGPTTAPAIATGGDLTAAVFTDVSAPYGVYVTTSDGRGLAWTTPVRIDDDTTGATKLTGTLIGTQNKNLAVQGDTIFVVWRDDRNATGTETRTNVYFSRSTDRGATWEPDTLLSTGFAAADDDVRDWTMAVDGDHVHVLISVDPDDASPEELWLVSSADAGQTFGPGVAVTTVNGTGVDVDHIGLAVDGMDVYVVWADDRSGNPANDDVWFNRSSDGGQTFGADVKVNSSALGTGDVEGSTSIAVFGSLVFVAWAEELASDTVEELRGAVSINGGANFFPDFQIGEYTAGVDDVDLPWIDVAGGSLIATWEDDRSGADDVYVATSTDGAIWTETQIGVGGQLPRLVRAERGDLGPNVGVIYTTAGATGAATLAYSRDAGLTWSAPLTLSSGTADVDNFEAAWNVEYGNFVGAYLEDVGGANGLFAGGLRPQTLEAVGLVSGGDASFALDGWRGDGTPRFSWVLGSASPGTLPLPFGDGRDLGITPDGTFLVTLNDAATFLTTLDGTGVGATGTFPVGIPAGTTFQAVAVSFEVMPVAFSELSDVVELTVQ